MIPADVDNFAVTCIVGEGYFVPKNLHPIYIRLSKKISIIPREISNCEFLTDLYLGRNNIVDISALSNCKSLTELHICGNQVKDIMPLSKCTSLTKLYITNNDHIDISLLPKHTRVVWL